MYESLSVCMYEWAGGQMNVRIDVWIHGLTTTCIENIQINLLLISDLVLSTSINLGNLFGFYLFSRVSSWVLSIGESQVKSWVDSCVGSWIGLWIKYWVGSWD